MLPIALAVLFTHFLNPLTSVHGHGIVTTITFDDVDYGGYPVFGYNPTAPQTIVRAMYNNGPITDVTSAALACNGDNDPAPLVANVKAGATVKYQWTAWPTSHLGPITNYLASCNGDCKTFKATDGKWFKIDAVGFDPTKKPQWATGLLIQNNNTYTHKLPSNLPSGEYLLRHELIALHQTGQPQYYPLCSQIKISGGSGDIPTGNYLTRFPGAYKGKDPGYTLNIYWPPVTSYTIEGPAIDPALGVGNPSNNPVGTTTKSHSSGTTPTPNPNSQSTPSQSSSSSSSSYSTPGGYGTPTGGNGCGDGIPSSTPSTPPKHLSKHRKHGHHRQHSRQPTDGRDDTKEKRALAPALGFVRRKIGRSVTDE